MAKPKHFSIFLVFQAASLIIQYCPELFSSIDEEVCLLQEEIASLEKVSIKLELEMQEAIKIKGECLSKLIALSSIQLIKELSRKMWWRVEGEERWAWDISVSRPERGGNNDNNAPVTSCYRKQDQFRQVWPRDYSVVWWPAAVQQETGLNRAA